MNNTLYLSLIIVIGIAITFSLRLVPFLLFGGKKTMPTIVKSLSDELPPAMMAVLVLYCLKDVFLGGTVTLISGCVAIILVIASYLWKHQLLISVFCGTVVYMCLIRLLPEIL